MKKNTKFKLDIDDNPFDHLWLYRIDEKGRMIFSATGLGKLDVIWQVGKRNVIETKQIYKFPNLKQTNYEITMPIQWVKFIGGEGYESDSAIKVDQIKIKFNNGKEKGLISYIEEKINDLNIYTIIHSKGTQERINYEEIVSKLLSRSLSVSCYFDSSWNYVNGCENIFESNELLDQLLISSLFINARWGDRRSHLILFSLIRDRVKSHSKYLFRYYNIPYDAGSEVDLLDSELELLELTSDVILDKNKLPKRYKYHLNNNNSFYYFMTGGFLNGINKKQYYSVIRQFIRDKYYKNETFSQKTLSLESEMEKENTEGENRELTNKLKEDNQNRDMTISFDRIKHNLSEEEQAILEMNLFQGLTLEEIGEKIGMQKSGVFKKINKIIQKVKDLINK